MTSGAGRRGAGRPGCRRHVRARGPGTRGAAWRGERQASVGGPGRLRHGRYQVAVAGGGTGVITARSSRELPLTWRGAGEGASTPRCAAGTAGDGPSRAAGAVRPRGPPPVPGRGSCTRGGCCRAAGSQPTRASAGEQETPAGQGLLESGQRAAPSCDCGRCHGNWGTGCGDLRVRRGARWPPEDRRASGRNAAEVLFHVGRRLGQASRSSTGGAKPPRGPHREPDPPWERTAAEPPPAGSGMAKASGSRPTAHPEAETSPVCPFLTALQILLQPLPPQPRCPNARSRICSSSSSRHNTLHCPTGTSLETRRTRVPLVRGRACTCLSAGPGLGAERGAGEGAPAEGGRAHAWRGAARGGVGCWRILERGVRLREPSVSVWLRTLSGEGRGGGG